MSDLANTFTIKISVMPDGSIDVWSKGMPDTRSFAGQNLSDLPWSHQLGLFALGRVLEAIKVQELTEYKRPSDGAFE